MIGIMIRSIDYTVKRRLHEECILIKCGCFIQNCEQVKKEYCLKIAVIKMTFLPDLTFCSILSLLLNNFRCTLL